MMGCTRVRGLIAARLYEPLAEEEQERLDRHLEKCAHCRQAAADFEQLIQAIPRETPPFAGDLLPAVREGLRARPARPRWQWAGFTGIAAVLVFAVAGAFAWNVLSPAPPSSQVPGESAASPVRQALAKAEDYAEQRRYAEAYQAIDDALKQYPEAEGAGEAQAMLADIAFEQLKRYETAYKAYAALRRDYPETFSANPNSIERFDLLADARAGSFQPLYAIDAARNGSGNPFDQLQEIVVRHRGRPVGRLAVAALCDYVRNEAEPSENKTALLERVKELCSDPGAIAQVNMALGDTFWHDMHDAEKARPHYAAVAESGQAALARTARQTLSEIDGGEGGR